MDARGNLNIILLESIAMKVLLLRSFRHKTCGGTLEFPVPNLDDVGMAAALPKGTLQCTILKDFSILFAVSIHDDHSR